MVKASFWSSLRKYFFNMVKQKKKRINVLNLLTGKIKSDAIYSLGTKLQQLLRILQEKKKTKMQSVKHQYNKRFKSFPACFLKSWLTLVKSIPTVWDPVRRLPRETLADKLPTSLLTTLRVFLLVCFVHVCTKETLSLLNTFFFLVFSQMLPIFAISGGPTGITMKDHTPLREDVAKSRIVRLAYRKETTLST